MQQSNKSQNKSSTTIITVLVIIVIAVVYLFNNLDKPESPKISLSGDEMKLVAVDVGQGDCTLLLSAEGNVIVDAGPGSAEDDLIRYIKDLGITDFEYAVFTHPHEDHIGGGDGILENFSVKNVIMPDATSSSTAFSKLLTAIENSQATVIEAKPRYTFSVGKMNFTVLAPNSDSYDELNDYSVVLRLDYGNTSVMLTGDATSKSEKEIIKEFGEDVLDCDILKVGHHGSSSSTCDSFLSAVSPEIALIYCAQDNDYGHPHKETIEKLKKNNINTYRTDTHGTVTIPINYESGIIE